MSSRENRDRVGDVLLDDIGANPTEQIQTQRKKKKYISFLPKMYWFFYRRPLYFLLFIPTFVSGWILTAFLFFHHFVFVNDKIVKYWSEGTHSLWGMFSAGMWSVLKSDPEFCGKCSNPEFVKTVFCF